VAVTAFLLAVGCVQIAAPEGFSTCGTAPARTISGVADSEPGLIVSIVAFRLTIGAIMPQIEVLVNQGAGSQEIKKIRKLSVYVD
jgi:hypothetical protein